MHKAKLFVAAAVAVVGMSGVSFGAAIGVYDFTAGESAVPTVSGATFDPMTRVSVNALASPISGKFASTGYATTSTITANVDYTAISVSAAAGYRLDLESISLKNTRADHNTSQTGPKKGEIRSSFLGYSDPGGAFSPTTTESTATWDFTDWSGTLAGFRIYGFSQGGGGTEANKQLILDDVTVNGHITALAKMTAAATPPSDLEVLVGATVGGTVQIDNVATGGTRQANLHYTLSGSGLVVASGTGDVAGGGSTTANFLLDTSTPSANGGTLTVTADSLAYSTNGTTGLLAYQESITTRVLAHSNASFGTAGDVNELEIDFNALFGEILEGSGTLSTQFTVGNRTSLAGEALTAALDLDGVVVDSATNLSALSANLNALFDGSTTLEPGINSGAITVALDTATPGAFETRYTLQFSDEDLAGATNQNLTLVLKGAVSPIVTPEPGSALLALAILPLMLRRRQQQR